MKKIFNFIVSFNLMIFVTTFIIFNILELSIRKNSVYNYINRTNYYEKIKIRLESNINEYIFDENIKKDYIDYLNINLIQKDIYKLLNNNEINHIDDFKSIIYKYSDDEDIINNYSKNINSIYKNSLFPIKEYNILYKYYLGLEKIILIDIILLVLITISITYLLITKNTFFIKTSLLSTFMLLFIINILFRFIAYKISYIDIYFNYLFNLNANIYLLFSLLLLSLLLTLNVINNGNLTHKKM